MKNKKKKKRESLKKTLTKGLIEIIIIISYLFNTAVFVS